MTQTATISTLSDVPQQSRNLYSWLTDPLVENARSVFARKRLDERAFVDSLCMTVYDLPSMQGLIKLAPKIETMPVGLYYKANNAAGVYSDGGIRLNSYKPWYEKAKPLVEKQTVTLLHEYRHGYHDISGCYDTETRMDTRPFVKAHVMCHRMMEADATASSLVQAYELAIIKKNTEPFRKTFEIDNVPAHAYWNTVKHDENAHWDGRAAQAAYEAYLHEDNLERLEVVDLILCKAYSDALDRIRPPQPQTPESRKTLGEIFKKHMQPLGRMPFVNENGDCIDREKYDPVNYAGVFKNVTPTAQKTIDETWQLICSR